VSFMFVTIPGILKGPPERECTIMVMDLTERSGAAQAILVVDQDSGEFSWVSQAEVRMRLPSDTKKRAQKKREVDELERAFKAPAGGPATAGNNQPQPALVPANGPADQKPTAQVPPEVQSAIEAIVGGPVDPSKIKVVEFDAKKFLADEEKKAIEPGSLPPPKKTTKTKKGKPSE